ncbi:BCS1 N terminal-domain-containing protein [Xylaria palmicola]|nr:BCS1 N terminal-domain-containing protein [Xylaria palmicola]
MADPLLSAYSSSETGQAQHAALPVSPPGQLALLDWFFPGFSMFAGVVQRYLHIDLNLYIPLLLLVGVLIVCWNYTSQYLSDQVETYFMSVVDIRTDDEIYNILMAWVAAQRFSQGARRFVVNTSLSSRSWNLWRWDDEDEDDEDEYGDNYSGDRKKKKKALSYTPSFGSHYFWYRGRLLLFRRTANREQNSFMAVSEREEISISCFGRNPWILKELLLEAREKYIEKDEHKTQIYRGTTRALSSEPTWQRCMSRASRPFSTVILNEKTKQELVDDVSDYLNPSTQRWYANRGIPYRRGYLLHGPPGTGKSSLSLALAGFFKMRIYIVSLSSVNATEEVLGGLFAELPRRCVVLLEDIDTAGLTHTREENGNAAAPSTGGADEMEPGQVTRGNGNTNNNNGNNSFRLSLSGLLNILDGVASQEGRILIMTTNHIEKLDKALIRPGRVDMIVEFGLADDYMTSNIFRNIFAYLEGDDAPEIDQFLALSPDERQAATDKKAKDRAAHDARIDELARTFASRIPAHEFSPAELQGHLMRHKHDPQKAVDTAEDFVERTRKDHKEKALKEAEDKRKAEAEKAEAAKKKAAEAAAEKKKAEAEEVKKKVEEEIQKKFGEEIRKKVEAEMAKSEKKTADEAAKAGDAKTTAAMAAAPAVEATEGKTEKPSEEVKGPVAQTIETGRAGGDDKGHSRQDSGYGTPASGEP